MTPFASLPRLLAALLLGGAAGAAQAQLGGLFEKLVPPALKASEPAAATAAPSGTKPAPSSDLPAAATRNSTSAAIADGTAPPGNKKAKDIAAEMAPDRLCNRPQERFNVAEKLAEYGGTEATLRLERLIASDYKYSDLTPQDREMLKYIAQTTVWVPVEVESALGSAFELVGGSKGGLTEADEINRDKVAQRLDKLKETVKDFPSSVKLVVDPKMADGAAAKFGGVLQVSKPFMETMVDKPQGGDLVLAHELSHIYKRHAIKRMQFELISTSEGWELAKKLLGRAMKGAQTNAIQDGLFMMTTTPKLVSFVRNLQLKFTSEQELEADACSVVWLRASGVDPAPAWDQFVAAFASADTQPSGYAGSHPPTAEREANYRVKLSGKTPPGQAKKAAGKAPAGKDQR